MSRSSEVHYYKQLISCVADFFVLVVLLSVPHLEFILHLNLFHVLLVKSSLIITQLVDAASVL